jgi:NTE family protein
MRAPASKERIGLVLGCGGTLGMSWSVAVLHELEAAWDWDARQADAIIGTSAGAELTCLLGGGTPVADLLAAQTGDPAAPAWLAAHLAADPGRLPPLPRAALGSPALTVRALRGRAGVLCGLTGLAPAGRRDPGWLVALAQRFTTPEGWLAHPCAWLVAADYETGERVAFGSPGAPAATPEQALRASWGLPGWMAPVHFASRRWADGGIVSPASADLAAPLGLDTVIVLAPMASSDPGRPTGALARGERLVRRVMTRTLDAEVAVLRERGIRVVRLEPNGRDLAAMGPNFMDARRRAATLASARASSREALAG